MWRVIAFFVVIAALAFGLAQFAEQPGQLELTWGQERLTTSLYVGVIALAVLFVVVMIIWSILRALIHSPRMIAKHRRERREQQGRQALSRGMIAVGSGHRLAWLGAALASAPLPILIAQLMLKPAARTTAYLPFHLFLVPRPEAAPEPGDRSDDGVQVDGRLASDPIDVVTTAHA